MKTVTKLLLTAGAMIASAPAFATVAPSSDSVDIVLNGQVASVCDIKPDAAVSKTLNMADPTTQSLVTILYSCNSPYTVKLKSANGGMKHLQSGPSNFKVDYDVKLSGLLGGSNQTLPASSLTGANGVQIDASSSWANIVANADARNLRFDLEFTNGLNTNYQIAGDYTDTLTVTIAAAF